MNSRILFEKSELLFCFWFPTTGTLFSAIIEIYDEKGKPKIFVSTMTCIYPDQNSDKYFLQKIQMS